jgi:mannose-6-phosphate isomerase-like protein (cupin superfamily)
MRYKIIEKQKAPHYTWGNNCDSWVLTESPGLSVKQENMPPGSCEVLHFHKHVQQFFYILNGIATFYVDDQKMTLSVQQGITILPGAKHYIANESDDLLEFIIVSQPAVNADRVNV